MSMFEDVHYRWRETYFVLFPAQNRPKLKKVETALASLSERYQLSHLSGDDQGRIESLTLISPDDFAALDVCYTQGAEVLEQGAAIVEEMRRTACDMVEPAPLKEIKRYDGRFDVLHFERIPDFPEEEEDEDEEMLDPGALLVVLAELAKLTGGVAVDPQTGTVLNTQEG